MELPYIADVDIQMASVPNIPAKKYYEKGYEIIDENTGHILTETEIENLKPEVIVIPIQ